MTRGQSIVGVCSMLVSLLVLLGMAYYIGRCDVDQSAPTPLVESVAQVRCSMYVAEDLSATWENSDKARDECYYALTGHHWFVHWQHLRNR